MVEVQQAPSSTARKIGGFLVVGVLAVVIDFALFNALLAVDWTGRCGRPTRWPCSSHDVRVRRQLEMDVRPSAIKSLLRLHSAFAGINVAAVIFIEAVVVGAEVLWEPRCPVNLVKAAATLATVRRFFAYKVGVLLGR